MSNCCHKQLIIKASKIISIIAAVVIFDSLSRAERAMESEMMPTSEWAQGPKYFLTPRCNCEDSH